MADDTSDFAASTTFGSDLNTTLDGVSTRTRGLQSGAASFSRAMSQAFAQAVSGGKQFDDVLKSLTLRLSSVALQASLKPLTNSIGSSLANLLGGSGGIKLTPDDNKLLADIGAAQPFAKGGVIAGGAFGAKPTLFADGGVVATPSFFPLGGARSGVAGEAGPEAILPLRRGPDGKLGVAAGGSGGGSSVTINIATPDASSFRRSESYVTGMIARAVTRGQRSL